MHGRAVIMAMVVVEMKMQCMTASRRNLGRSTSDPDPELLIRNKADEY
jgi:hypothetical protein